MKNAVCNHKNKSSALPVFEPVADIVKRDQEIVLFADMPGVDEASVQVGIENAVLTLRGKAIRSRQEDAVYQYRESGDREYYRAFKLNDQVDQGQIQAKLNQGVLELVLPLKAEVLPRKIEVAVK